METGSSDHATSSARTPAGALSGIRVLDLATLYPAPLVAAMLGDLGADVVKVEAPSGDPLRVTGAMRGGRSFVWALADRNKRSVVLDHRTDDGLALLHRLTEVADVVIVNQPLRLLERWGCTYDAISARNPRAVMVSVSAFGLHGPAAELTGNGTLSEAFGGLTHMTGTADGPPVLPSVPVGDVMGGWSGVSGVLAALYWRDAADPDHRGSGLGQLVDVALYEAVLPFLGTTLVAWDREHDPVPCRTGSRIPATAPRNVYRTHDGRWVAVSGPTDAQVARVLALIGADDELSIARFGRSESRAEHADELDALVADWVAAHDAEAVVAALIAARIPVTEVHDPARLVDDPHVQARGSIVEIDDPDLGPLSMPAPTPRLSATPGSIRTTGPALGAGADDVLREWLGEA